MRKAVVIGQALITAVAALQVIAAPAAAQQEGLALEEVIVTAQKKSESLQDTPISLTAFGSEQLETQGIGGLDDIGSKVPSLTVEPFPINAATLRIFIRGIGISDTQVTQDPPVGIYVDGVYIARSTGTALDVAELERIEILRGPQGTLYGRNTTGGAINLITKKPSTESVELRQKFSVGNRELFTSKTSANIPLGDALALKLAYLDSEQSGFIDNHGPGGDFGDREVRGYRLDLRWLISDTLALDYAYDRSDMRFFNYMYQAVTPPDPNGNKGQAEPIKQSAQANSVYSDSRFSSMASGAPFEASDTEIEGHALTLTADFDWGQLKYMAAWRELSDASYADLGGGAGSTVYRLDSHEYCGAAAQAANGGCTPLVKPVVTQEQFSHELQFSGALLDERLEYIVGAYYFEETATEDNTPFHHQISSPVDNTGGQFRIVNFVSQRYDIDNEAWALFGQATWTPPVFDERLHLTLGARHSQDEREAIKNQRDETWAEGLGQAVNINDLGSNPVLGPVLSPILAAASFQLPGDRNFNKVRGEKRFKDDSFSAVLEYDISDDVNVYAKRVEAYKSGGFNTRDPQVDGQQGPASDGVDYGVGFADGFDEEKVLSYELGIKSELFGRRLRLNADVFYSEFDNMQINFVLAGTVADTKVINAGEAQMQGMEADLTFLATRNLMLMLNYAYLDAEVTSVIDPFGNDVTRRFSFSSAPEHSYTAAADWTVAAGDWGRLSFNLSTSYMDERNGGGAPRDDGSFTTVLRDYQLWNARLGLHELPLPGSLRLNLAAWVNNFTDEEYELYAIDNLPQADRAVVWGEPRSYGLDLVLEY